MNNKTEFKFGDYAIIEQKRHGVPNEMFVHKVIDQLCSNTWVDVPVQSPATETMHDEMEDVCLCICCGVDQTEVRRYRVKDMRRHSPVSAVTDEKKGSTITLQAANELIASLESAGELSIKETKVMALAKAFKQLAAENAHLKSRMQRLICIIRNADNDYCMCGDLMKSHVTGGCGCPTGMFDYHYDKWLEEEDATPATDRIVAGIKADEEKAALNDLLRHLDKIDIENLSSPWELSSEVVAFVNSRLLREGADK
ncbi:hypothetical protein WDU42_19365 [Klebsiella pneumoniae]